MDPPANDRETSGRHTAKRVAIAQVERERLAPYAAEGAADVGGLLGVASGDHQPRGSRREQFGSKKASENAVAARNQDAERLSHFPTSAAQRTKSGIKTAVAQS